jgi:hypothetical protein
VPWEEEIVIPEHLAMSHFVGEGTALVAVLACFIRRRFRKPEALQFVLWAVLSFRWTIAPELTTERIGS